MSTLIATIFFQVVFSAPVSFTGPVTFDNIYPINLTTDCTDQSSNWDLYAPLDEPLEITAANTQQGDGCLDSSAIWPGDTLP